MIADRAVGRCGRGAFSLAEMMIALAILAMGLLVIGAALPIGVRYTRDSVNLATGEAAAEYALEVVAQSISLPHQIFASGTQIRAPALFQPRSDGAPEQEGQFLPAYEPVIKVWPLFVRGIAAWPGCTAYETWVWQTPTELRARAWLSLLGVGTCDPRESDCPPAGPGGGADGWVRPPIASVALFYPPITASIPLLPSDFSAANPARDVVDAVEIEKAVQQRTVCCVFYRRVSYAVDSDPSLYELITVVSRLPSARHRFPVQQVGGSYWWNVSAEPDTAAPIPWLIWFTSLPAVEYDTLGAGELQRVPRGAYETAPPATLSFLVADSNWGALLPPGSVLIPAVNDRSPTAYGSSGLTQRAGFVPSAPDALPIYEVQERVQNADQSYTIVVKNNGLYPWLDPAYPQAWRWPVWVVPPPFEELDASGQPLYPDRNPIVAVSRRTVRLREIP